MATKTKTIELRAPSTYKLSLGNLRKPRHDNVPPSSPSFPQKRPPHHTRSRQSSTERGNGREMQKISPVAKPDEADGKNFLRSLLKIESDGLLTTQRRARMKTASDSSRRRSNSLDSKLKRYSSKKV